MKKIKIYDLGNGYSLNQYIKTMFGAKDLISEFQNQLDVVKRLKNK